MRGVNSVLGAWGVVMAAMGAGAAQAEAWLQSAHSAVRLIEGPAEESGALKAALEFRIRPGWKTYWRTPGEAGIPPSFDFSGSENVASVETVWPRPHVFESFGYQTLGYSDVLVLPLKVTPMDPEKPVRLTGDLFWGVCADICVPEEARVALSLDGAATPGAEELITEAEAAAPDRLDPKAAACRVAGSGDRRTFSARLTLGAPPAEPPVVVVEGPQEAWFGATETEFRDGALHVTAPVDVYADNIWIDRSRLRLTVLAGPQAVEFDGCGAAMG